MSLSDLRLAANAATFAPWRRNGANVIRTDHSVFYVGNGDDAAFISSLNPSVINKLLDLADVVRAADNEGYIVPMIIMDALEALEG